MAWSLLLIIFSLLAALIGIGLLRGRNATGKASSTQPRTRYAPIDAVRMMPPNSSEKMMELARSYVAKHNRLLGEIVTDPPTPEIAEAIRVIRRKLAALSQLSADSSAGAAQISFADSEGPPSAVGFVDLVPTAVPASALQIPHVAVEDVHSKDSWEPWDFDRATMTRVEAAVRFDYVDRKDQETSRKVDIQSIATNGRDDHIVVGYCWLRFGRRTFRASAISSCVDDETGEVIPDIVEFLREKYVTTPQAALDSLERERVDVLKVLLFVAKADDRMTAAERAIMLSCCKQITNEERITASEVDRLFRAIPLPTLSAFKRAALNIHRNSSIHSQVVFAAVRDMIATDKRTTERERDAIEFLARRWGYANDDVTVAK